MGTRTTTRIHHLKTQGQLLTKPEAAERLNVSLRFIDRCIYQRRIRFVHIGRFIRIPESAIEEFIEAGTVETMQPGNRRSR